MKNLNLLWIGIGHIIQLINVQMVIIFGLLMLIGYTLNGDGTLRFELGFHEIGHGDRFYVGRFNKDDTTMMRYGIQQDNPTYLTVIITILHQVK
ncbi:hypothetical protein M9Y10_029473 [Tritrichomonas musculus]|uniref:Uncharacterized protein n=1 Tax=Tritrichomonas musculus TaxID=1915356 RepID=A0ABR2KQJ0_9EUKA